MAEKPGQDRQRIKVGNPFDRLALPQHESIDSGPLDDFAADAGLKPELDEHEVPFPAPPVDFGA